MRLKQQDFYDLMLELALALPYQEYQRFIDASFAYAGECAEAVTVAGSFYSFCQRCHQLHRRALSAGLVRILRGLLCC